MVPRKHWDGVVDTDCSHTGMGDEEGSRILNGSENGNAAAVQADQTCSGDSPHDTQLVRNVPVVAVRCSDEAASAGASDDGGSATVAVVLCSVHGHDAPHCSNEEAVDRADEEDTPPMVVARSVASRMEDVHAPHPIGHVDGTGGTRNVASVEVTGEVIAQLLPSKS
jgi:hypothetical protein